MDNWGNNPDTYQAIGAVFSSIGIIAVFISTILAWRSLRETKIQRLAIEDEMAARMRPWIGLFDCQVNLNLEENTNLDEIHLLIKNFGILPAQKASLKIIIKPLSIDNNGSNNSIIRDEQGEKVLLPQEEGNTK